MTSPNTFVPLEQSPDDAVQALLKAEIDAPPHYISIYHETKEEFLPSIAEQGLMVESENKNIGSRVTSTNMQLDRYRPAHVAALGVSRLHSLYAYPSLEDGHTLGGATKRFMPKSEKQIQEEFELLQEWQPDHLRSLGALTVQRYLQKVTDPAYLRAAHPGDVLELKVDPERAFVADLELFNRIQDGKQRSWIGESEMPEEAATYWDSLITLAEYKKWYDKPEFAENGNDIVDPGRYKAGAYALAGTSSPLVDAPDTLPEAIYYPEILIPKSVPVKHLRLLQG